MSKNYKLAKQEFCEATWSDQQSWEQYPGHAELGMFCTRDAALPPGMGRKWAFLDTLSLIVQVICLHPSNANCM